MMSSLQAYFKRVTLLVFVLSCFIGRSSGFQVSPAFRNRRKHQLSHDVVKSFRSSFAPPPVQERSDTTCVSNRALDIGKQQRHPCAFNLYRSTADGGVAKPQRTPLFDSSQFRLFASPDDDGDKSPTSSKLRSFISKIFNVLARPVRLVMKPLKWIRNKFQKKDEVAEKYIEESIEEQANAVHKAIAEIEAKADEYQQKNAAMASEQDMLDKTDLTTQEQKATTEAQTDTVAKTGDKQTKDAALASEQDMLEKTDPTAQEKKAAAEAQTDTVATAGDKQAKDAALASEQDMLEKTDPTTQEQRATAEAQTDTVTTTGDKQAKDAALASEQDMLEKTDAAVQTQTAEPATDQATLGKTDLIAQKQQATAQAQIEIVEKVEVVQSNDAALATEKGMLAQLDKPETTKADIMTEMKQPAQKQTPKPPSVSTKGKPVGDRWAVAAPGVDLSGDWSLIVSDDFKKDYDEYLKQLGQPFIVRSVALTLIGVTKEQTEQKEEGRTLFVRGTNARGIWKRTLVSSGADKVNDQYSPLHVPIDTADDERVDAESWWEDDGTVHRSWMRGLNKYGGGDFESKRYLDEGGKVLVCESIFHPNEKDRKDVSVTWRFLRNGETLDA